MFSFIVGIITVSVAPTREFANAEKRLESRSCRFRIRLAKEKGSPSVMTE